MRRPLRCASSTILLVLASAPPTAADEGARAPSLRAAADARRVQLDVERDGDRFRCVFAGDGRDVLQAHLANPTALRFSSTRLQLAVRREEPPECPVLAPPDGAQSLEPTRGLARLDGHAVLDERATIATDAPRRELRADGVVDFHVELELAEPGRYAATAEVALGGGSDGRARTVRAPEPVVFARPRPEGLAEFAARATRRIEAVVDEEPARRLADVARSAPRTVELVFHIARELPQLKKRMEAAGGDRYRFCIGKEAHTGVVMPPCATVEQTREVTFATPPRPADSAPDISELFVRDDAALLERQGATSLYATDAATVKRHLERYTPPRARR
jgi:hypothetical protein